MLKKKKTQSPTCTQSTPLPAPAPSLFGLSSHLDWVPLGIPSAFEDHPSTDTPNPSPASFALARLKYYLAQASGRGTPKLPMGPAPEGLHSQEAQICPNTVRHPTPPPYPQGPDSQYYLLAPNYLFCAGWLACYLVPNPPPSTARPLLLPASSLWGL